MEIKKFIENEITFMELVEKAKEVYNPRKISPFIEAGGVSAAILTEDNNIYTGVCIDTSCSLGMCAERNAIANMITNGESKIKKLVCYCGANIIGSPCGACREYLMQLDKESGNIEILTNLKEMKTVRLKDLIPDWWGARFESRDQESNFVEI
ncbi:MAG: cytidine deaminase [Fibrobacter sp.]|nr:cytidine deaminase [Fibrobacter sp.]